MTKTRFNLRMKKMARWFTTNKKSPTLSNFGESEREAVKIRKGFKMNILKELFMYSILSEMEEKDNE